MKLNNYSLFAAATMLFAATSCSQEESLAPEPVSELVSFSVSLQGIGQSRAVNAGDGMTATNLYYEIYQGKGDTRKKVLDNYGDDKTENLDIVSLTGGKAEIKLPLLRGEKYDVIFWAQAAIDKSIYDPTNLESISVNYEGANANQEAYDAFFCGLPDFQATSNVTEVELKRPFAQLNFGSTEDDWNQALAVIDETNAPVTHSEVHVTNLATTFDALYGDASGEQDVTFTKSIINGDEFVQTFQAKDDTYYFLAMNYLLVPGQATSAQYEEDKTLVKSTTNVTATFWRGGQELFTIGQLPNVAIQRNYRTNIIGELLAADKTFVIEVVPAFIDDEIIPDTDAERLMMAAAIGGEVTLSGDVTLPQPLTVQYDMTIDLNGYTISYSSDVNAHSQMIKVNSGTTLTVKDATNNGKISYKYTGAGDPTFGWGTYTIYNSGKLVVDGGTIEMDCSLNDETTVKHMYSAIQQINNNSATTIINGGKVSTPTYRSVRINSGTLTVNAGTLEGQVWMQPFAENTAIAINGGSFEPKGADGSSVFVTNDSKVVNLTVTGGTFATKIGASAFDKEGVKGSVSGGTFGVKPNENLIAEGYTVSEICEANDEQVYVVTKAITNVQEFLAALENTENGDVIALTSDIDLTETITLDGVEAHIALNGHSFNATSNESRPFNLINGASLTICAEDAEFDCGKFGLVNITEGTLTINGGTFTNEQGNNGAFIKVDGSEEVVINLNNVIYKAGTTDSGVLRTGSENVTVNVDGGEYEAGFGFLIYNGSIKNATISATNTGNGYPAVYSMGDNVTVEGCTIESAGHAIAVSHGKTITVNNCTWTGDYGTTSKMKAGCVAIINIDGVQKYKKTSN